MSSIHIPYLHIDQASELVIGGSEKGIGLKGGSGRGYGIQTHGYPTGFGLDDFRLGIQNYTARDYHDTALRARRSNIMGHSLDMSGPGVGLDLYSTIANVADSRIHSDRGYAGIVNEGSVLDLHDVNLNRPIKDRRRDCRVPPDANQLVSTTDRALSRERQMARMKKIAAGATIPSVYTLAEYLGITPF